jgi:hypothetical protein
MQRPFPLLEKPSGDKENFIHKPVLVFFGVWQIYGGVGGLKNRVKNVCGLYLVGETWRYGKKKGGGGRKVQNNGKKCQIGGGKTFMFSAMPKNQCKCGSVWHKSLA